MGRGSTMTLRKWFSNFPFTSAYLCKKEWILYTLDICVCKTDNCTKSVTINPKKLKIGGLPSTQREPAPMGES